MDEVNTGRAIDSSSGDEEEALEASMYGSNAEMRDGNAGRGDGGSFSGMGRSKRGSAGCCSWIVCGIAIFCVNIVV